MRQVFGLIMVICLLAAPCASATTTDDLRLSGAPTVAVLAEPDTQPHPLPQVAAPASLPAPAPHPFARHAQGQRRAAVDPFAAWRPLRPAPRAPPLS